MKDFPAVLYLSDPADDGTFQETNAFNLFIVPDDWKGNSEGKCIVNSANVRYGYPIDQFWDIIMSGTSEKFKK